jgi:nitroreductase
MSGDAQPRLSNRLPPAVDYLIGAAHQAPSADNSQPWRFHWNGQRLSLRLDPQRGAGGLGADHPGVLLAIGAAIENMMQAAAAAGWPPEALDVAGIWDEDNAFAHAVCPQQDMELPECILLQARHTNRGRYAHSALDPSLLACVRQAREPPARVVVLEDLAAIRALARLIRLASEERFQDERAHRWLAASLRLTESEAARGDGLDVKTLALPPGGVLLLKLTSDWRRMAALNRVGMYKLLAQIEAAKVRNCGALIAIAGGGRARQDILAAGRLMERVWITLNAEGVSVHPFFVLADQFYRLRMGEFVDAARRRMETIVKQTASLLGTQDEDLLMVLRVGKAVSSVKKSRRLPLDDVLTLESC